MDHDLIETLWTKGGGHTLAVGELIDIAKARAEKDGVPGMAFNLHYSPSIYLLAGFAFEVLLKAAYLLHGGDRDKLGAGGIGHDLLKGLDLAEAQGFQSKAQRLRPIIESLRTPHMKFYFRYESQPKFGVPNIDFTHEALETLTREVQDKLK